MDVVAALSGAGVLGASVFVETAELVGWSVLVGASLQLVDEAPMLLHLSLPDDSSLEVADRAPIEAWFVE